MRSLENLNFIVTGATSGIGKSLVLNLLKHKANVAYCGRSKAKLADLQQQIEKRKTTSVTYASAFDMTKLDSIPTFVKEATNSLGSIDVLINCAGANISRDKVAELTMDDLDFMLKVNAQAPFLAMQTAFNCSMKVKQQGMIINIMSTVCHFSNEGIAGYTASKTAFDGLSKVFRKEVREHGIKVCNLYPGGVDTPFREAKRPLYLTPEQVVDSVLFIAQQDQQATIDELTIRPLVEKNFS